MKKIKYYTPDITEFCVGFEFEIIDLASNDYKKDKRDCEWNTKTLKKEHFFSSYKEDSYFEIVLSYLSDRFIRVKYLDEQDILDLGWVKTEDKCPYTGRNYFKIVREDGFNTGVVYKIVLYQNSSLHYMWESYSSYATDKGQMVINIKNKTELKKLMEQLNINHGI